MEELLNQRNEEKTVVSLEEKISNPEPNPAADSKPGNQRTNPGAAAERKHLSIWCNLPKINQKRLKKLIETLAAENITEPKHNDIIRITRLSPNQSFRYLQAVKASKKAAAE